MTSFNSPAQTTEVAHGNRVMFFALLVFLVFVFLIAQLFRWQILEHDRFTTMAKSQSFRDIDIQSKRGVILSKEGVILAADRPVWDVYISVSNNPDEQKQFAEQQAATLQTISTIIGTIIDPKTAKNTEYSVIAKEISDQQKKAIEHQNLFGVYFTKKQKRFYPNGRLASHILGFVGVSNNGQDFGAYGVEGYFWGDMKGKEGKIYREENLQGSAILTEKYRSIISRGGRNVELTIDSGVQAKVEESLKKGVRNNKAKSGTAIIMNPRTGAIIAMANYPDYDPNYYWQEKDISKFRNKAVSDVYEYGSVNKPMTVAAAINEKKITPQTICDNSEKFLLIQERKIFNFNQKVYGRITPKDVLLNSVNICTAKFGLMLGEKKMYNYMSALGFGSISNVGLQDEETSQLTPVNKWLKIDLATIAFGQTISATPLQVLSAFSTLANGGVRMQPYIVQRIYNNDESIEIKPQVKSRIYSTETTKQVTDMLVYAASNSHKFDNLKDKYLIAGKTGTAQIARADGPGYDDYKVNTTFVGYAPANDPTMVMIVRLEEPSDGSIASLTAAPVWNDLFVAVKDDLGIKRR